LSGDIGFFVSNVNCPVAQRNAYSIEACCLHVLEVIAVDEGTVTNMRGLLAEGLISIMLTSSVCLASSDIDLCQDRCIDSIHLQHSCCEILKE
jgi:hypothetical protein